jgi:anti-sigma factor RsiW
MSSEMQETTFSDEVLTAYLDGELDAPARERIESALQARSDLRCRLGALQAGERPFRRSFDALLEQAPTERLQAILQNLSVPTGKEAPQARRVARSWRPALLAAGFCAVFVAGISFDRLLQFLPESAPTTQADGAFDQAELEEWREAVVVDLGFFTAAGLASIPEPEAKGARELDALGLTLGTALPPERVALAGAELKRADILQYEGRPLGQILYIDPQYGPIALCILKSGEAQAPLRIEQRSGFSVGHWADGRFSYMLIARNRPGDLRRLAESLVPRLNS